MHKLTLFYNIVVDIFIYVKKDEYHKPGVNCYILKFSDQERYYSERAKVYFILIHKGTLFQFILKSFFRCKKEIAKKIKLEICLH